MKRTKTLGLGLLFAASTVMGCADPAPPAKAPATTTPANTATPGRTDSGKPAEHVHGNGPNGGVLFDLGKYHAEFTVNHGKKECTVLMIGDDEKTPVAVAAKEFTLTTKETKTEDGTVVPPMTVKLLPTDEADGKAKTFVGTDEGIGNVADFEGTVIGEIDGKPSQGSFKE